MKKFSVLAACLLACGIASATCSGTGAFYTCTDNSGNMYNVQKFGNTTNVQGMGPNGSWNQQSQTYGNTTMQQGTSSHGGQWNQTIQTMPGMTTYSGTNSQGQPFQKTCGPAGCF